MTDDRLGFYQRLFSLKPLTNSCIYQYYARSRFSYNVCKDPWFRSDLRRKAHNTYIIRVIST